MPYWTQWSTCLLMYGAVAGIGAAGCEVPRPRKVTVGSIAAGSS